MVKITKVKESKILSFIPFMQKELKDYVITTNSFVIPRWFIKYDETTTIAVIHFMANGIKIIIRDNNFLSEIITVCEKYENLVNKDGNNTEIEIITKGEK
jgi:hypothetical protein